MFVYIRRLTAFWWSAGHKRGDDEEQQDCQNYGLHDACCVQQTADGMLRQVPATEFILELLAGSTELNVRFSLFFRKCSVFGMETKTSQTKEFLTHVRKSR